MADTKDVEEQVSIILKQINYLSKMDISLDAVRANQIESIINNKICDAVLELQNPPVDTSDDIFTFKNTTENYV